MTTSSDETPDWDGLRNGIIGLGETSVRKSYFPELQRQIAELERRVAARTRELEGRTRALEERERQLRASEAQLRTQNQRLRELDQLKDAFVNAVSHDLRAPLTAILGFAELLEDGLDGPLSPSHRHYVQQILRGGHRLGFLINDLLDSARMQAGTFSLYPSCADLRGLIREVVASMQPELRGEPVRLVLDLPPLVPRFIFDAPRIEQVLVNLIGNALKFTRPGSQVTVHLACERAHMRCAIEDQGPGIPPADLPRLFQRFSQLEAGKLKGGTGLGLSICKAIVEAHGGSIGVDSPPGQGATFWFTLPLTDPAAC